jgi:Dolichyl-phosphate-mannose-protein mannosyltransferase
MTPKRGRPKPSSTSRSASRTPARTRPPRHAPALGPRLDPAPLRHERWWLALVLFVHVALALWGAARNSVTFDENFHVPSGVMIVARQDYDYSVVNPPLVKALCAVPVLLLGARLPTTEALVNGEQGVVGESFMRENAARYHTLYVAARCVIVLLSVALGLLVWSFARRLYGSRAALLAVAVYATLPDVLAHAGLATMDLATGLGFLASSYLFWKFLGSGRWTDWAWSAFAFGLTFLTRFSAALLVPGFVVLIVLGTVGRWIARPSRAWLGLLLLVPAVIVIVNVGYLGKTSFLPLSLPLFESEAFRGLGQTFPGVRLPLPDSFLAGLDHQLYQSQAGHAHTYLFGRVYPYSVAWYFPLAALVKWPIGFLGLLLARVVYEVVARRGVRRPWEEPGLLVPVSLFTLYTIFFAHLDVGIRYLFPILPVLAIWVGGLAEARESPAAGGVERGSGHSGGRSRWAIAALALLLVQGVETARTAPWYLSFFNAFAGGPGRGYRIVNDSNVDWGQGLIALREEMSRRGISKITLAYHGTADPAIYGIDYVPYTGGALDPNTEWLAVSSYYFVGLPQRMMTTTGRTPRAVELDLRALWPRKPDATPAGCMFLFRQPGKASE